MNHIGMPGPGGSLGSCAICGKNFLADILIGNTVTQFSNPGIVGMLSAHKECVTKIENITDWKDLPEGPFRAAFEEHAARREVKV